jgi:hypothetical protein
MSCLQLFYFDIPENVNWSQSFDFTSMDAPDRNFETGDFLNEKSIRES